RGFIVVAFCSAILHHWMCKIPTEVATLTINYPVALYSFLMKSLYLSDFIIHCLSCQCVR
ncbi:hypothetical protein, partial [Piscirickettsia salmonis]|uniref:hypothetical protein n=1 Tax=Piscirickettsia salmonis TaxID=1238 RepID=UPI0009B85E14